jgi:hypothetical protein
MMKLVGRDRRARRSARDHEVDGLPQLRDPHKVLLCTHPFLPPPP